MKSLNDFARGKLDHLRDQGTCRVIQTTDRRDGQPFVRNGQELISFCCNDYLGFTHHPTIKKAAKEAIDRYGTGSGASRLITGNHPLLDELEQRLAKLKGTEAACVFSSGYMANIGIIPTFIGPKDIIFADELSHACLRAGAEMSKATFLFFRHNDVDHLKELIATHRSNHENALILTDGVFSMNGDLAPLDLISAIAQENDCWLMTDDAHGIGVLGDGRGSAYCFSPVPEIPLQMGTLSKGIGSMGGYICASKDVIDLIKTRARSLIYTTASPPANIASAIAALDIIEQDKEYRERPMQKARLFTRELNLPAPQSPIVPIIVGDTFKVMHYAEQLEENGFLVSGIRPPTVAKGTARLRFTFSSIHQDEDIIRLAHTVRELGIV